MNNRIILIFMLVGVVGAIIILINTPLGIGVANDSVFYLSSAENLLVGRGLSWPLGGDELKPLTHYPPLYPLTLAGLGLIGFDLVQGARLLAAVLFGTNIVLLGWLVFRHSKSWPAAVAASVLAGVSPILIDIHLMAMTEPLFLFFLLATLALLAEYMKGASIGYLIVAGVTAGLTGITRYIGISVLVTGFLILILMGRIGWRRRLVNACLFAGLGLTPLSIWYLRNFLLTGSTANRSLLYHPLKYSNLQAGAYTASIWLLPPTVPFRIRVVVFLMVLFTLAGLLLWRGKRILQARTGNKATEVHNLWLVGSLIIFILVYGLLLFFSLTFIDASTRLNARILSPAYTVALLIIFIVFGLGWFELPRGRFVPQAIAGLWVVLLASYSFRSVDILHTIRTEGSGFTGRVWQTSETVAVVGELEPGGILYSTEALPLYFLTGRPAYWVPEKFNPIQSRAVEDYQSKMAVMRTRLRNPNSALVLFNRSFVRAELPPVEEVIEGLLLRIETSDGAIYIDPTNAATGGGN